MTIINALSLNNQEQQAVVEKIKDRVTSKLNLAVDFSKLHGNQVDFSLMNRGEIRKLDNTIGKQFTVPTKTYEGLNGQVQYTELNDIYMLNVTTPTKNPELLIPLRNLAKANEKLDRLAKHVVAEGYTLSDSDEVVIQTQKAVFENAIETFVEATNMYTLPIYKDDNAVGYLVFDEINSNPIVIIGNDMTAINEEGEIITIFASGDSCSLKWADCMQQELGCSNWSSCLLLFGTCISACCTCAGVVTCLVCVGCAIHVFNAAWSCRMCVPDAARPKECPVK